ncbi:MAG: 4-phosphoerythronate dehydrogenase [Alcanivoracaceae bacterium]|nr:4-phosphoerythronate dehydrogenase [Alcanivoracaceae bacterium]
MKIIADENIPFVKQAFASLGEVVTWPGRLICQADSHDADVLLVRSITLVNADLLKDTAIKFVASATSGINHIDEKYLQQNNIAFAHALGSNAISVAQYVMAGICYWSLQKQKPLSQLSIGIIGYGSVGIQVANLCNQFGIRSILNDPPLSDAGQKGLKDIESALACDIVSLHVPLTLKGKHATKHLINAKNITELKPGGLFLNASRGEVVHEKALLSRKLQDNDLSIILDVWQNEPNINAEMLAQTLIATPHIAGYSLDGKIRGTEMIYHACCKFFNIIPQWSIDDVDFGNNLPYEFEQTKHQDIRISVLAAYNISEDSKKLKKMLKNTGLMNGHYFDGLRKNYPVRREWN